MPLSLSTLADQVGGCCAALAPLLRRIDMFPKDGCLWVYGFGEDGVVTFTGDGIENLRQIIADERTAGRAPPSVKPAK